MKKDTQSDMGVWRYGCMYRWMFMEGCMVVKIMHGVGESMSQYICAQMYTRTQGS